MLHKQKVRIWTVANANIFYFSLLTRRWYVKMQFILIFISNYFDEWSNSKIFSHFSGCLNARNQVKNPRSEKCFFFRRTKKYSFPRTFKFKHQICWWKVFFFLLENNSFPPCEAQPSIYLSPDVTRAILKSFQATWLHSNCRCIVQTRCGRKARNR